MTTVNGKTLTIFGCGYIGSAFAQQALDKGLIVQALTRNPKTAQALRNSGVHKVVEATLHTHTWHKQLNPTQDFVLNCVSAASQDLEGYRKSYIEGQRSILAWLQKGHAGTFIYTSSTGVYPQNNGEWVDENSFLENPTQRGALLLEAEHCISNNTLRLWDRYFILRLAGIYGPERHYILDKLLSKNTIFEDDGEHFLNLIYKNDICETLWRIFTSENTLKDRIYNLCDNKPTPKKIIVSWLAQQLGIPQPVFKNNLKSKKNIIPNRKISNRRICNELALELQCVDFRQGYKNILDKIKLSS